MALEEALEYINADELVEITPDAIRIRKRILNHATENDTKTNGDDLGPAGISRRTDLIPFQVTLSRREQSCLRKKICVGRVIMTST